MSLRLLLFLLLLPSVMAAEAANHAGLVFDGFTFDGVAAVDGDTLSIVRGVLSRDGERFFISDASLSDGLLALDSGGTLSMEGLRIKGAVDLAFSPLSGLTREGKAEICGSRCYALWQAGVSFVIEDGNLHVRGAPDGAIEALFDETAGERMSIIGLDGGELILGLEDHVYTLKRGSLRLFERNLTVETRESVGILLDTLLIKGQARVVLDDLTADLFTNETYLRQTGSGVILKGIFSGSVRREDGPLDFESGLGEEDSEVRISADRELFEGSGIVGHLEHHEHLVLSDRSKDVILNLPAIGDATLLRGIDFVFPKNPVGAWFSEDFSATMPTDEAVARFQLERVADLAEGNLKSAAMQALLRNRESLFEGYDLPADGGFAGDGEGGLRYRADGPTRIRGIGVGDALLAAMGGELQLLEGRHSLTVAPLGDDEDARIRLTGRLPGDLFYKFKTDWDDFEGKTTLQVGVQDIALGGRARIDAGFGANTAGEFVVFAILRDIF